MEAGRSDGTLMGMLLDQSVTFLELCGHADAPVSSAAALCVADVVSLCSAVQCKQLEPGAGLYAAKCNMLTPLKLGPAGTC